MCQKHRIRIPCIVLIILHRLLSIGAWGSRFRPKFFQAVFCCFLLFLCIIHAKTPDSDSSHRADHLAPVIASPRNMRSNHETMTPRHDQCYSMQHRHHVHPYIGRPRAHHLYMEKTAHPPPAAPPLRRCSQAARKPPVAGEASIGSACAPVAPRKR